MGRLGAVLATGGVLVAVIAWEMADRPRADVAAEQTHIGLARPPTALPQTAHVNAWVTTTLARPLFSPNRRPSEAAEIGAADTLGLPRLTGILVGPFGRRAIFAGNGRKPVVVDEGSRIDAYTVKSIGMAQVQLLGPNGLQSVQPSFDSAAQEVASRQPTAPHVGQAAVPR